MKNILFLTSLVMFMLSCEKEANEQPSTSLPLFGNTLISDSDAQVFIIANGYGFSDQEPSISVYGNIMDKSNAVCGVESLSIGGVAINNFDGKFSGHFDWVSNEGEWRSLVNSFKSEETSFVLKSKDFGNINEMISLPSLLKMNLSANSALSDAQLSKSEGLTISFDSSLRKNEQKVGASVVYHSVKSNRIDASLPDEHIAVSKVVDAAVGSITFSPSDLSVLPEGGIVVVLLGNAVVGTFDVNVSENTISVISVSYEFSSDLTVVQ